MFLIFNIFPFKEIKFMLAYISLIFTISSPIFKKHIDVHQETLSEIMKEYKNSMEADQNLCDKSFLTYLNSIHNIQFTMEI